MSNLELDGEICVDGLLEWWLRLPVPDKKSTAILRRYYCSYRRPHTGFEQRSVRYFPVITFTAVADRRLRWEHLVLGWLLPAFTHCVLTAQQSPAAA